MSTSLPCCIDVPPSYRPKAQYALRMLLLPLGIDPVWIDRAALTAGGIYYGTDSQLAPDTALRLPYSARAAPYFDGGLPYDQSRVAWSVWQHEQWPLLFEDDLVAAAFFWLSGWQEHVTRDRDIHGRFQHRDSLQAALGITTRPVVDAYRERLVELLSEARVKIQRRRWGQHDWVLCPTIDVDYIRKWRKGMVYREIVEYFLCNHRRVSLAARWRRLGHFSRDAMRRDVYKESLQRMINGISDYGTGTMFIKGGAHGANDVAYRTIDPFLVRIVRRCKANGFEIGLHGSYFSHNHEDYLAKERGVVAALAKSPPTTVRQHFLRYEAPATLRLLVREGFCVDSTLGFCETEGFRHGTCLPFRVFDNTENACSELWELSPVVMESALFNRRGLSVEEGIEATEALLRTCRRFGGAAVMLWHNLLWDDLDHLGWWRHFDQTLSYSKEQGAGVVSLREVLSMWQ